MIPWWHELICIIGFTVGMLVWAGMMEATSTASRHMNKKD